MLALELDDLRELFESRQITIGESSSGNRVIG